MILVQTSGKLPRAHIHIIEVKLHAAIRKAPARQCGLATFPCSHICIRTVEMELRVVRRTHGVGAIEAEQVRATADNALLHARAAAEAKILEPRLRQQEEQWLLPHGASTEAEVLEPRLRQQGEQGLCHGQRQG